MSERAIYNFRDEESFCIYKHDENNPEKALIYIERTLMLSNPINHFHAAEFGAAFIAANKPIEHDIYLANDLKQFRPIISYLYEIWKNADLCISISAAPSAGRKNFKTLFSGRWEEFKIWIKK